MVGEAWRGVPLDKLPAAADPRSVQPNQPPKPSASDRQSLGEAIYPSPAEAVAPDPGFTMPEGLEADPALMSEFTQATKELRLDKAGADRLLALHAQALAGQSEAWRTQTEAAFSASELADIRADFNDAVGRDADAQECRRLLAQTGLGNHPAVIRVISRLLGRR
jgi:hypothetical protein